jgi:hypothetical protein
MWWKAIFADGESVVEKVRVRNRHDCCGERLTGVKITIDGQFCGTIPPTKQGAWVEVKCDKPLKGKEIRLTSPKTDHLQLNAVQAFGWSNTKKS